MSAFVLPVIALIGGIIIVLMLDNYRIAGKYFEPEDVMDISKVHHEQVEIVLAIIALLLVVV